MLRLPQCGSVPRPLGAMGAMAYLDNVEIRGTGAADVDRNRADLRRAVPVKSR